jgi:CDP-glucose 4,6-dehydratase
MVITRDFWRGRRVFLTGHTGFKGGWMSLWLQSLGASVHGYSLAAPTSPSLFEAARVAHGMSTSIEADVRDQAALAAAVQTARPEIVFHLAAQPLVRQSYQQPVQTYATNIMGTAHLLEAVRSAPGVLAVVNITSDKCYENLEPSQCFRETDPMGGYDPYSSSKAGSELVTAAYRQSYFNPAHYENHGVALASARAGNVIGGGDWAADRLIPDIIQAFGEGLPAQIRNPNAVRPWQHVLEPLRGYLILAERLVQDGPAYAEAWNFGPSDEDARPVEWIVREMANRWGEGARWQIDAGAHPHEARNLRLDIRKAQTRLNWEPVLELPGALDLTLEWFNRYRAGADMREISMNHIAAYQALAAPVSTVFT